MKSGTETATDELKMRTAWRRIKEWHHYTWREGEEDGLYFCQGLHHRSADCEWEMLTHKKLMEILDPLVTEGEP